MRGASFGWAVLLALWLTVPALAQGSTGPAIISPTSGQTLQGQVSIRGTSDLPGFSSAELDFAYGTDQNGPWFPIQSGSQPISNDLLGTWDTTAISDGEYILRLRVTLQDGSVQDATVTGLHIQNYTTLPTATVPPTTTPTAALPIPTPIVLLPSPSPTAVTPTFAPVPSPTPLPENPAELTAGDIYLNLQRGALVILGIFVVFGLILRLRRS